MCEIDLKQNLNYFEEAGMYIDLMREHNLTQEQLAAKLNKSQPAVANKIRLLKLFPSTKKVLTDSNLSERHARALARLHNEQLQLKTLNLVYKNKLSVKDTEKLVEKALKKEPKWDLIKSINDSIKAAKRLGVDIKTQQSDMGEYTRIIIHIPKKCSELEEE